MASEVEDLRARLTAAGLGDPEWSEDGRRLDSPVDGAILSPNTEAMLPGLEEDDKSPQELATDNSGLKGESDGFREALANAGDTHRGEDIEEDCEGGIPIGAGTGIREGEEGEGTTFGPLGSTPPRRGPGPASLME